METDKDVTTKESDSVPVIYQYTWIKHPIQYTGFSQIVILWTHYYKGNNNISQSIKKEGGGW